MRVLTACLLVLLLTSCIDPANIRPLAASAVILAFGDSLTYGTGVSARQSYPAVLARLTGRKVIRSGVPGEISSRGLHRLATVLEEVKPQLVVLCHGGNDVLRRVNPAETQANLRKMINLIRKSGADVVVLAVPKFGLFPKPHKYYEDIKADLSVPVELDIISDLESDRSFKSDQVHFNSAGYRRLAEATHQLLIDSGALPTDR